MNKPETPPTGDALAAIATHSPAVRQFGAQRSAIALAYSSDEAAPRVVAKGRGLVAQTIIERARQHGVYMHESRELVALLMQVDLDQRIPPQLYRAVAELLAWVYRLEQRESTPAAAATGEPPIPTARNAPELP